MIGEEGMNELNVVCFGLGNVGVESESVWVVESERLCPSMVIDENDGVNDGDLDENVMVDGGVVVMDGGGGVIDDIEGDGGMQAAAHGVVEGVNSADDDHEGDGGTHAVTHLVSEGVSSAECR